jgi:hypothetical protein
MKQILNNNDILRQLENIKVEHWEVRCVVKGD